MLADATRWREWAGSMITVSEWEREGDPAPGGVGAIRRLGRPPAYAREQILEYDPPRHLAYTIVSGLPVNGYHADIDLLSAPRAGARPSAGRARSNPGSPAPAGCSPPFSNASCTATRPRPPPKPSVGPSSAADPGPWPDGARAATAPSAARRLPYAPHRVDPARDRGRPARGGRRVVLPGHRRDRGFVHDRRGRVGGHRRRLRRRRHRRCCWCARRAR